MGGYFTIEERKTKEEMIPMEIERKFWIDTLPDLPEERRSDVRLPAITRVHGCAVARRRREKS